MKFDNDRDLFLYVLKGDVRAVALCEALSEISQVWDDLIDRDIQPAPERVTGAFYSALIDVPSNPFFQAFSGHLLPVMQSVIFDWLSANQLEKTHTQVAYTLRDSLAGFVVTCASLIGGKDWAIEVAPLIRSYVHDEDFQEYMKEHGNG